MKLERIPNKVLRYYQLQADIVVDQLLIGGGGQNSRECLALGKPVLTRIHPHQEHKLKQAAFPYQLPYIPTERANLKQNLIDLITNSELRNEYGRRSLEFAKGILTPIKAAKNYIQYYESIL
jgi:hypothetical protein